MSADAREIRPLTGIRGVAAIAVMIYHFSFIASPFPSSDSNVLGRGYLAVDLFFLLSGMVMAIRQMSALAAGSDASQYFHFLKRRIARIYPLYFVVLILMLLTAAGNQLSGSETFPPRWSGMVILSNLFLVQNWGLFVAIGWVSWSLSSQVAAYVLFPVLFAVCFHRIRTVSYVSAILAAMLLCIAAMRDPADASHHYGYLDVYRSINFKPLLRCIAGFTFGLLAYRLAQVAFVKALISGNVLFIGIVLATMASLYLGLHDLIVYVGLVLLVLCCYGNSKASNVMFGNRILCFLGLISYSLYLVHGAFYRFIPAVSAWTREQFGEFAAPVYHVLPFLPVIALAYCSYRLIELPGRRYAEIVLGLTVKKGASSV